MLSGWYWLFLLLSGFVKKALIQQVLGLQIYMYICKVFNFFNLWLYVSWACQHDFIVIMYRGGAVVCSVGDSWPVLVACSSAAHCFKMHYLEFPGIFSKQPMRSRTSYLMIAKHAWYESISTFLLTTTSGSAKFMQWKFSWGGELALAVYSRWLFYRILYKGGSLLN